MNVVSTTPVSDETKDVFVSIEIDNGEGYVLFVRDVSKELPIYYRWYIDPIEGTWEDTWATDLYYRLFELPKLVALINDSDGRVVSIQAAPAWPTNPDLIGFSYEQALQYGLDNNCLIRRVMEDGKPYGITADTMKNRWNLHIAKGCVYRAEEY